MKSVMPWMGLPRRFFIAGPWLLACSGDSLIPSLSERAGPVGSRPFCLPESVAHPPTLNLFVGRLLLIFLHRLSISPTLSVLAASGFSTAGQVYNNTVEAYSIKCDARRIDASREGSFAG